MPQSNYQSSALATRSCPKPERRLYWTGDIWGATTLMLIILQEEGQRQEFQAQLDKNPASTYWQEKLEALGAPIEMVEIRRVDEWRIEWGFTPYDDAAARFREGFQGRAVAFPPKDFASVYRSLAAMAKDDGQSKRFLR